MSLRAVTPPLPRESIWSCRQTVDEPARASCHEEQCSETLSERGAEDSRTAYLYLAASRSGLVMFAARPCMLQYTYSTCQTRIWKF